MAVTPDFMASFSDLADGPRVMFGDPSEDKKSRGDAVLVQQFQYGFYLELYTGR
jgi:hypothetical protein